jgi:hypothetical protein
MYIQRKCLRLPTKQLFYGVVSIVQVTQSRAENDREGQILREMRAKRHGLVQDTTPAFSQRDER